MVESISSEDFTHFCHCTSHLMELSDAERGKLKSLLKIKRLNTGEKFTLSRKENIQIAWLVEGCVDLTVNWLEEKGVSIGHFDKFKCIACLENEDKKLQEVVFQATRDSLIFWIEDVSCMPAIPARKI